MKVESCSGESRGWLNVSWWGCEEVEKCVFFPSIMSRRTRLYFGEWCQRMRERDWRTIQSLPRCSSRKVEMWWCVMLLQHMMMNQSLGISHIQAKHKTINQSISLSACSTLTQQQYKLIINAHKPFYSEGTQIPWFTLLFCRRTLFLTLSPDKKWFKRTYPPYIRHLGYWSETTKRNLPLCWESHVGIF